MDDPGRETDHRPTRVTGRLTRRPKRGPQRRFSFFGDGRFDGIGDLGGGLEAAELPIIGPIILGIFLFIAVVVLLIVFGGLLIAFIEVTLLGLMALAGWLWAWLRGHPKVAVIDVDEQRWVRDEGPAVDLVEDEQSIRAGTDPATLGYRLLP